MKLIQIDRISIETNDSGPWGTDLWWKIIGKGGEILLVPNGATGESQMLKYFQRLAGFDNDELSRAMTSTHNAEYICWKNQ